MSDSLPLFWFYFRRPILAVFFKSPKLRKVLFWSCGHGHRHSPLTHPLTHWLKVSLRELSRELVIQLCCLQWEYHMLPSYKSSDKSVKETVSNTGTMPKAWVYEEKTTHTEKSQLYSIPGSRHSSTFYFHNIHFPVLPTVMTLLLLKQIFPHRLHLKFKPIPYIVPILYSTLLVLLAKAFAVWNGPQFPLI